MADWTVECAFDCQTIPTGLEVSIQTIFLQVRKQPIELLEDLRYKRTIRDGEVKCQNSDRMGK